MNPAVPGVNTTTPPIPFRLRLKLSANHRAAKTT
jgi:hypothetical protein